MIQNEIEIVLKSVKVTVRLIKELTSYDITR